MFNERETRWILLALSIAILIYLPLFALKGPCNADSSPATATASIESRDEESLDIVVVVGSLRDGSHSRQLADAMQELAPQHMRLEIVEIGALPFYNPDIDGEDAPRSWQDFRQRLDTSDGVLFITPEYNRSIPGVLKNAIDIASRPHQAGPLARKPGAVVSLTTGRLGGFGAHHHLRQILVVLDVPVLPQPEVFLSGVDALFDQHGNLIDVPTRQFLHSFLLAFDEWIARNSPAPAP